MHCTLYIIHYTRYNIYYTLYSICCTLYTIHYKLYNIFPTLYTVQCTLYTIQFTMYSVQCIVYTLHFILVFVKWSRIFSKVEWECESGFTISIYRVWCAIQFKHTCRFIKVWMWICKFACVCECVSLERVHRRSYARVDVCMYARLYACVCLRMSFVFSCVCAYGRAYFISWP